MADSETPKTPPEQKLSVWDWAGRLGVALVVITAVVSATLFFAGKADADKVEEHAKAIATLTANIAAGRESDEKLLQELRLMRAAMDDFRQVSAKSLKDEMRRVMVEELEAVEARRAKAGRNFTTK